MLPSRLVLVTTALGASALAQDQEEGGGSAPYKICPTVEYSEPYCCTHLLVGLGIGCRVRKLSPQICPALLLPSPSPFPKPNEWFRKVIGPEEYKSLRDFQNDCFIAYVERQAACCNRRVS